MNERKPKARRLQATSAILFIVVVVPMLNANIQFAQAQSSTATLTGTCLDKNGAAISDVTVAVVNADTRLKRQVATDSEGHFEVSLLPPGRYDLVMHRSGFETWKSTVSC